jgi:hypothetical protein
MLIMNFTDIWLNFIAVLRLISLYDNNLVPKRLVELKLSA